MIVRRLMPPFWLVLSALLLVNPLLAQHASSVELAQIDDANYPEIKLYVTVRDDKGEIIQDLEQKDFVIHEDGTPVEITDFSAGNQSAITTMLTIDRSGSMEQGDKIGGAKAAAVTFIDLMRDQDQSGILIFASTSELFQSFTADRALLKQRIQSIELAGGTAWYDAVLASLDALTQRPGRRSIILLSDGMDNRESAALLCLVTDCGSQHSLDEAIEQTVKAKIPVYTIGFGDRSAAAEDGVDEARLQQMAETTDGKYFYAPDSQTLAELYRMLSMEFQKEYVITYRSPRPNNDGTRRKIDIQLTQSGGAAMTTTGRYVEKHMINVRSHPLIFLMMLVPLLLLLLIPSIPALHKPLRNRRTAPADVPTFFEYEPPLSETAKIERSPVEKGATFSTLPQSATHTTQGEFQSPPNLANERPKPVPVVVSAAALATPQLVVRYLLPPGEVTLGSRSDNHIVLKGASIASHHARIRADQSAQRYVVQRLSDSPLYVSFNGDPAQERATEQNALKVGSRLRLGDRSLILRTAEGRPDVWLELTLPLPSALFTIGRGLENDLVINDPVVAERQVEIRREEGRTVVVNLTTSQPVQVSFGGDLGQMRPLLNSNALKAGSLLRIGTVTVVIEGV